MDFSDYSFKVCIKCWTYNHAPYIKETLDGFSIQRTQFPYVCVIVDDASTDGEPDVIRNYLSFFFDMEDNTVARNEETEDYYLSFARHKTNENCFFAVFLLKYNHHGKKSKGRYFSKLVKDIKYHALCEGDDYWTDSRKLQKQVSILEEHPDYGLCYTDFNLFEEGSQQFTHAVFENGVYKRSTSFEEHLVGCGFLAPMSWVYRKSVFDQLVYKSFTDSTFSYALAFFKQSKVFYIPEVTCVYRGHSGSVSRPTSSEGLFKQYRGVFNTQLYFAEKYQVGKEVVGFIKSGSYIKLLPSAIESRQDEFIEEASCFFKEANFDFNELIKLCDSYLLARQDAKQARESHAYKIGKAILKPIASVRRLRRLIK